MRSQLRPITVLDMSSDDSDKDEALTTELDKEFAMSNPPEKLVVI
jgi:hypothetical protein